MKFIALGSNLLSPVQNIRAAVMYLSARGFEIVARAPLYITAPVPVSDQPDFVNTVIQVAYSGMPHVAMQTCLMIEKDMGRVRGEKNEARIIDIDLIAWDDAVMAGDLNLPHPHMHERLFVMAPMCDIASDWRHPVLQQTAAQLKSALPQTGIRKSEEQW